ncbi:transferrin receptor 1b isoform X2 [Engraulis encrasicolus]
MATTMNQAKTSISKMFNGEPRSYTRFSLAQNTDGECGVEMKLSTDGEDEAGPPDDVEAPRPYIQNPLFTHKNIIFLVLGTLLIFFLGYIVAYVSHNKTDATVVCPTSSAVTGEKTTGTEDVLPPPSQDVVLPSLNWDDIVRLLEQKLDKDALKNKISDFTLSKTESHEAGSDGDNTLANKVLLAFNDFNMRSWTNEHSVNLPRQSSENPNKVLFGTDEIGTPKGFLAYSEVGNVTGRVVYANYGSAKDLADIKDKVDLKGSVLLLRAGQMSYAQKVANAATYGASAALIYLDPADQDIAGSTELYGHVHLGSGDPYTPGFPSFQHTQFPPTNSSGLPSILAQTITANMAKEIFRKMSGDSAPENFQGKMVGFGAYKLGSTEDLVTVSVNNVLTETTIHNVFGVIEGNEEPDRYVVLGAQRDSWGPGLARSTVGTTLLVEIARAVSEMVRKDHLSLKRSLVFTSWSGGDYGNVGSTEWQEGYLTSLNMRAVTYISLDGVVTGRQNFKASASPLLYNLLKETLKKVNNPLAKKSLFDQYTKGANWESSVLKDMKLDDAAYSFLALSGIPSISFGFHGTNEDYPYYGTVLDEQDHLNAETGSKLADYMAMAGQVAGQMAVRLAHDHLLPLDVARYGVEIRKTMSEVYASVDQLKKSPGMDPALLKSLSVGWLGSALGSYGRASRALAESIGNSNLEDKEMCRILNDRIIKVEHNLLSPYVSVTDAPFRHILFGSGKHSVQALLDHLSALKLNTPEARAQDFPKQFAFITWTIESCANDLAGPIWDLNNEI